jgi:hypothetical protein
MESRPREEGTVVAGSKTDEPVHDLAATEDLEHELLESLIASQDYAEGRMLWEPSGKGGLFPTPERVRWLFRRIWDVLASELDIGLTADDALLEMADLVVYSIPDGTRSTLTIPAALDVELDAGLFCLAVVHTLQSLGARNCVIMTHTAYNRRRGPQDTNRFLRLIRKGVVPFADYAARQGVQIHLVGTGERYELTDVLRARIPRMRDPKFHAYFLVDYREEMAFTEEGRQALEALPTIDVAVRHTKFSLAGGWIPTKMLRASLVYAQNGSLFSNWRHDEYVVMAAVCLAAKLLHMGEALAKSYVDVDTLKRRHQLREASLFHKVVKLNPKPRKHFVLGTPVGLCQVYY